MTADFIWAGIITGAVWLRNVGYISNFTCGFLCGVCAVMLAVRILIRVSTQIKKEMGQ